jgi:structural maintenance of chromosome 4
MSDSTTSGVGEQTMPKPRLIIQKLVLENFKSYAGVKTIGPFHKKFSSVVGPNGSGKSNVIDSMQFVFGRRASKLRLKKVSQLIHNSTEHPNYQYCKVTVHFCMIIDTDEGDNGYNIVPGSEFTVTRQATKDNKSKYFFNDEVSSYTQVTTLLRDKGIDLDNNRFLILQGEVEQIALMKPKAQNQFEVGLLEYLEDLIGSNMYVEPIEEQAVEVRKHDEERTFALKRMVATEKAKAELEGSKIEAEAYLQKERDLCRLNVTQAQIIIRDAKEANAETNEKFQTLLNNQEREKSRINEKDKEVTAIKAEYEKIGSEHDQISKEVEACQNEWAGFERKDIKFREDAKNAKKQVKKAERALKTLIRQREAHIEEIEQLSECLPKLEAQIPELTKDLQFADKTVERLFESNKSITAGLRGELKTKQKELKKVRAFCDASQANFDEAEAGLQIFQDRAHAAEKELEQVGQELNSMHKRIDGIQTEEGRIKEATKTSKSRIKHISDALVENAKQEQATVDEASHLEAKVVKGQAAQTATQGSSKIVRELMHATKKGGPLEHAGLLGRLGNLGAIDDQYDVAITTACPSLNHFVVETTSGGQACVEYLRKHSLGVSSFIILNKISRAANEMKKGWKSVPGTRRLFDLVKVPDKRVRPAFFHALRNTLVSRTLDDGMKVAYDENGRVIYRVVSLDGQIIEKNGTMSGGGSRKALGGGMKACVYDAKAEQALEQATADLKAASEKINDLRTQAADLKRQKREHAKQVDKNQTTLEKLEMERNALPEQAAELEERYATLKANIMPLTAEEKNEESALQKKAAIAEKECQAAKKKGCCS